MDSSEKNLSFDPVEKLRSDLRNRPVRESLKPVQKQSKSLLSDDRPEIIVQVVGSNGKGSVVHYLENLLDRSGIRSVSYVSPHLTELRERIHFDANPLTRREFRHQLLALPPDVHKEFTPFERLFLAALQLSVNRSAEILILEAGMGGRWDATSTAPADWTVLTSVDREHTEFLGTKRVDILREQLHQIPPESHLIRPNLRDDELNNACTELTEDRSLTSVQLNQTEDPDTLNRNLSLTLARLLSDQASNWLGGQLNRIDRPPGRQEVRSKRNRKFVLDVAHSPAALREWIRFTRSREEDKRPTLHVYGSLKGKELTENVDVLRKHIRSEKLWFTRPPSPRALDPKDLLNAWPNSSEQTPQVVPDLDRVWDQLWDHPSDTISIAGSFSLIKYFRKKLI
jgi:folylpolyglutamate synthase/dihydropteroate synthase